MSDPCMCHNCDLIKAGLLKSRDEMDEEAAVDSWVRDVDLTHQIAVQNALDAAFGKEDKKPCYPGRQSEWYEAMGVGDE